MNVPETIRPHDRRFAPDELDKTAIRLNWVASDLVARCEVEGGGWLDSFTKQYIDRNGYPTS